jgi:hypothetical protein
MFAFTLTLVLFKCNHLPLFICVHLFEHPHPSAPHRWDFVFFCQKKAEDKVPADPYAKQTDVPAGTSTLSNAWTKSFASTLSNAKADDFVECKADDFVQCRHREVDVQTVQVDPFFTKKVSHFRFQKKSS